MTAASPAPERRRPRPGSLERPVNGRLYRGAWLLVALPVLLLAFSVSPSSSLKLQLTPPAFDGRAAATTARSLASLYPDRVPGTSGAPGAANWFRTALAPYGFTVRADTFTAVVRGHQTT